MSRAGSDGAGRLTKPLMFLSSYALLFVILAIRFEELWLRLVCGSLALVGVLGLVAVIRFQRVGDPFDFKLVAVRPASEGASSYLAVYLLPFITVGKPGPVDLVTYTFFLVVVYLVSTNTGIIQVSPTLFAAGWALYYVEDEEGFRGYLLCPRMFRNEMGEGAKVKAYRMTGEVLLLEQATSPTH